MPKKADHFQTFKNISGGRMKNYVSTVKNAALSDVQLIGERVLLSYSSGQPGRTVPSRPFIWIISTELCIEPRKKCRPLSSSCPPQFLHGPHMWAMYAYMHEYYCGFEPQLNRSNSQRMFPPGWVHFNCHMVLRLLSFKAPSWNNKLLG